MITSNPEGARVTVEGREVGVTPCRYSDSKMMLTETYIQIDLEGYETVRSFIVKDGSVNAGAIAAGLFLVVPLLWVMGYPPNYHYELIPVHPAGRP